MNHHRLLLLLFSICLLAALACNLPTTPGNGRDAARQTLEAQLFTGGTPVPNNPSGSANSSVPSTHDPFFGLKTATAPAEGTRPAVVQVSNGPAPYMTQPGDTVTGLAGRFGLAPEQIQLPPGVSASGLLPPGLTLTLPDPPGELLPLGALLPDGEAVYGPPAKGFDIQTYVQQAGGYLSRYSEQIEGETFSGADIVRRIALETSTNPRLLLALLEYRSGWVLGQPKAGVHPQYPIGYEAADLVGLYKELGLATRQVTLGYYGWRTGTLTHLDFPDGARLRLNPRVNAGTAAVQKLFSTLYLTEDWAAALYGRNGFFDVYHSMFGDPWVRAAQSGPQFPPGLNQPAWELPFQPGEPWSFTGGPHIAWGVGSPLAAIDLAPVDEHKGCTPSVHWAQASVAGQVVRSERGLLILDEDGDGSEQTGWQMVYLHVAADGRVPVGTQVQTGSQLGHPSCEGGPATGRHIHILRKYNGEWIPIGDLWPFVLSGWQVQAGPVAYQGQLVKGSQTVTAMPDGSAPARIIR